MDKLNGKHLMYIIWGTSIISLKTYPTIYTQLGGRDSWIAVSISSILIMLFAYIIITISEKNNNFNIYDIYCSTLGKFIGNILIFFFFITLVLTLAECSSVEANSMHINMLPNTPVWFFIICFIIPAIYTVLKGKNAIIIITVISITLIIISGCNLAVLTYKYKDFSLLFPIMSKGITNDFLLCILKTLGMYSGFAIILPYLTEMGNVNSLKKYVGWALLFVIQMEIFSTVGLISTFGVGRLNPIFYPKLIQTQLVDYFGFIESGELYVLLQMLGGWYVKYVLTFFSILLLLRKLNIKSNFTIYILSIVIIAISFLCSNDTFTLFKALNFYTFFALVNFIIIPLTVYIIFYFKNRKAN